MLLKRPGTSAIAVLALALGIGLTTTMFSIVQGAFLRGLPFEESDRIMSVGRVNATRPTNSLPTSAEDFLDWQASQQSFEPMAAFNGDQVVVSGGLMPQRYRAARITPNMLRVLRVAPVVGRDFTDADAQAGAPPVVLISYTIWTTQFQRASSAVGQTVRINGEPTQIVGVMPDRFAFPQAQDLWRPLRVQPATNGKRGSAQQVNAVGRLKPGVSLDRASAEMTAIARRLQQQYPENKDLTAEVLPYVRRFLGRDVISTLTAMLMAVLGVLLIACANVANLQLARAAERGKEIALRTALGAGRFRVVRQLLVEGALLAAIGAGFGIALAYAGTTAFNRAIVDTVPPFWIDIRLDGTVLAFVLSVTALAAVLSSLMPAIRATRQDLNVVLKDESRSNTGVRAGAFAQTLIIVEVLLSCTLLVVSGLMIKNVVAVSQIDYPYATKDVFIGTVIAGQPKYPKDEDILAFQDRLLERLAAQPGVRGVAFGTNIPSPGGGSPISVPGQTSTSDTDYPQGRRLAISPGFFDTLRVVLIRGRQFTSADSLNAPRVAIVGEDMARKLFPGEDALGRQIKFGIDPAVPFATIVGIVPNLAVAPAAGDVSETMYVPLAQLPSRNVGIFAAATVDPLTLTNPMRKVVSEVDEDMAISDTNSLAAALWQRGWAFRVFGTLFMSFGVGALVLAGAGLYGVMAFGVRRRTQEIGVRMALGAARGSVLRMILWQGMWRVGLGIAIGLVPAWLLAGQMRALLTRVSQFDPLVFGLTILLLVLAGVAATIVPALRAASVDPLVALRHE